MREAMRWGCALVMLAGVATVYIPSGTAAEKAASDWKTRLTDLQKKYPQYSSLIGQIKLKRTELETQEAQLKASLREKKDMVGEKAGAVKQAVATGQTDALKQDAAKLGDAAKKLADNPALKKDIADQGQAGLTAAERYDKLKQNHQQIATKEADIERLKSDIGDLEAKLQEKIKKKGK